MDAPDPTPICPLCGREFDHKYEVHSKDGSAPRFATDVNVCERTQPASGTRTYYVHYP